MKEVAAIINQSFKIWDLYMYPKYFGVDEE